MAESAAHNMLRRAVATGDNEYVDEYIKFREAEKTALDEQLSNLLVAATAVPSALVLISPDETVFEITVTDAGVITATALV